VRACFIGLLTLTVSVVCAVMVAQKVVRSDTKIWCFMFSSMLSSTQK